MWAFFVFASLGFPFQQIATKSHTILFIEHTDSIFVDFFPLFSCVCVCLAVRYFIVTNANKSLESCHPSNRITFDDGLFTNNINLNDLIKHFNHLLNGRIICSDLLCCYQFSALILRLEHGQKKKQNIYILNIYIIHTERETHLFLLLLYLGFEFYALFLSLIISFRFDSIRFALKFFFSS